MVLPGPDGHSDAPDPGAIQAVVDAFAAHGIRLVILPTHAAIPERYVLAFAVPVAPLYNGPDAVSFDALKATYFPDAPTDTHYAIFGFLSDCDTVNNCQAAPSGPGSRISTPAFAQTGRAELPGTNFVVSLGHFYYEQGFLDSGRSSLLSTGGSFMHEFGHNLGLHHGGGIGEPCIAPACEDGPLYKPNYLSVMNPLYQLSGILSADTVGSNVVDPALTRLDYSEQVLPTGGNTPGELDENANLNELAGLGSGNADIFFFNDGSCGFQLAATTGPVDWNGDGIANNTSATADLNQSDHPGQQACTVTNQILRGHNDWSLILASLQTHSSLLAPSAAPPGHPVIPTEISSDALIRHDSALLALNPVRTRRR